MALPKISELSPLLQIVVILVVGALVLGASEYVLLKRIRDENKAKETQRDKLNADVEPLRPYREKLRVLEAENHQLESQLENLQRIVPNEKEVDNFVRLVQGEAVVSGVELRRFTAKAAVSKQFYVEVPFEIELDGAFYDVMQLYDRLGRLERIINVSDLKMGAIEGPRGVSRKFDYSPNESVAAICIVTTFFSKEEEPPPAPPAGAARRGARTARRPPAAKK